MKRCMGFLAGDLAIVLVAWSACSWVIANALAERVYPEPEPAFGVEDYSWIIVRENGARFENVGGNRAGIVLRVWNNVDGGIAMGDPPFGAFPVVLNIRMEWKK